MKLLNSLYANACLSAKKLCNHVKTFRDNQSGVSNAVVVIIVVLTAIVLTAIVLTAIFQNQVRKFIEDMIIYASADS